MNYIYDLVLNFSNGDSFLEFYEWREKDKIQTIQRIPIIKIDRIQMNDILNKCIRVQKDFLDRIYNKTLLEDGNLIEYALLVTDISKVVALKFNESGEVVGRSSLLLDEEEAVIDESLDYDNFELKYLVTKSFPKYDFLTREDRQIRDDLLINLKELYNSKNYDEINYLYEELYSEQRSIHNKYKFLMEDIKNNYSSKYNKLYEIIRLS